MEPRLNLTATFEQNSENERGTCEDKVGSKRVVTNGQTEDVECVLVMMQLEKRYGIGCPRTLNDLDQGQEQIRYFRRRKTLPLRC